uniref:KRAB domain-containing protein n=1 Tax=Gallus gallus TaxID=9031 RepID=A0A8V0XDW0_CHICK
HTFPAFSLISPDSFNFCLEEGALLDAAQQTLYQDVTVETYGSVASLGENFPICANEGGICSGVVGEGAVPE